jgi:hypothetical protein
MEPVSRAHRAIAGIRELQRAEQTWRAGLPHLAHRFAVLDLLTSCGFQYYADHAVEDDLALLDRALEALRDAPPAASPSAYEVAARDAVSTLAKEVEPLSRDAHDLDGLERVREVIIRVPPRAILGRTDPEASSDLVCWNECHGLLEGVASPYRTASRISALAYLSATDRYHVIDTMVAMRQRYELHPDERAALDVSIHDAAREFVDWYSTATKIP